MLKTPRTSGPESLLLPYHPTTTLAGDNGRSPGIRGNQGPQLVVVLLGNCLNYILIYPLQHWHLTSTANEYSRVPDSEAGTDQLAALHSGVHG